MLSLVLGSEITDASVAAIASSYPNLELLDLSGYVSIPILIAFKCLIGILKMYSFTLWTNLGWNSILLQKYIVKFNIRIYNSSMHSSPQFPYTSRNWF